MQITFLKSNSGPGHYCTEADGAKMAVSTLCGGRYVVGSTVEHNQNIRKNSVQCMLNLPVQ